MGASSVCRRWDMEDEIFIATLHTNGAIYAAYVQEMGRDEQDFRRYTITCLY